MGATAEGLNTVGAGIEQTLATINKEIESNVVEFARRMGPEVLQFLKNVIANQWNTLGLKDPVPLYLRLQAAEVVRKYSALPTNVDIGIKGPATIQYTGVVRALPAKVIDAIPERDGDDTVFRAVVETESETGRNSPDN